MPAARVTGLVASSAPLIYKTTSKLPWLPQVLATDTEIVTVSLDATSAGSIIRFDTVKAAGSVVMVVVVIGAVAVVYVAVGVVEVGVIVADPLTAVQLPE